MADDPTLGEVMRTLAATSTRLDQMASRLDRMAEDMDRRYVPRELYNARHDVIRRDVDALFKNDEDREKSAADTRRQLMFLVLSSIVTAVVSLIVTVVIYLASGGSS